MKQKNKFQEIHYKLCCLIFFLPLLFPPFTFGAKASKGNLFQYSVEIVSFKENEKEKYNIQVVQPYAFDRKTIKKGMGSLYYQKRSIAWSKKKRVFSPSIVNRLSRLIVKRFLKADHNQKVDIEITDSHGKTFIKGDTFLTPDGLNWRFTFINRKRREIDDFSIMGDKWIMLPQKNQIYKKKQKFNNTLKDVTNWIVIRTIRPLPSGMAPKTHRKEKHLKDKISLPANMLEIKKRLKILEDLKREGLVNEEEYRMKRMEILKSF